VKQTLLAGPHQPNTAIEFWRFLSDTIVERRTERFIIAAEYHFSTERVDVTEPADVSDPFRAWWMAAQMNVRWTPQSRWSATVRPEIAWDSHGRWTLAEQTVKALTTTLEYRIRHGWTNTILRLEHRLDDSRGPDGGFFAKDEFNPSIVALRPQQQLLVFGLVVTFDAPERR
jgi:putative OmpL-like beta-barrel porin-2